MKKYLMLGVAALALASCNKNDFTPMTQSERVQSQYNQAFVNTFGQPAANQTWGFGGVTRAVVDPKGNMWDEMPEVSPQEKKKVFDYVNMTRPQMKSKGHKYTETFPENITDYFVSQVWTGTDTYATVDGTTTGIVGSSKMNHLVFAESDAATITNGDLSETAWFHVNDFNAGDNTDWSGNMLINDAGTKYFAFLSSDDSNYHNKWIDVKGEDIDASLAGYYYICFDFISFPDYCYTVFRFKINGQEFTSNLPGAWTLETAKGQTLTYTVYEGEWPNGKNVEHTITVGSTESEVWRIDNVVQGNQAIPANDVYTDWIVRIVAAQPAETYDGRIMGEDLSANESSDFDFNDVVFDFKITETGAKILLQAAGGTLPLKIGGTATSDEDGVEVHKKFGVDTNIMVNTATNASPKIVTKPAVPFEIEGTFEADGSDIPVFVKKNGEWMPLTANVGEPASKFCCKTTTKWVDEYVSIELAYPQFSAWVSDPSVDWESTVVEKYIDLDLTNNAE